MLSLMIGHTYNNLVRLKKIHNGSAGFCGSQVINQLFEKGVQKENIRGRF
jgi:hypothetical protein